jgi:hypothetical protein
VFVEHQYRIIIMDFDHKIALINLAFSPYLRRRILELNGLCPEASEIHSTLSRIFTEHFHSSMTNRVEEALKMFAHRIILNLMKYEHDDPDYELIEFIEHAEKHVRDELKTARRWCPIPTND